MPTFRHEVLGAPVTSRNSDGPSARGSDFDALADLFLEESTAPLPREPVRSSERPSPRVGVVACELLIAGHLPVLSGAWVVQYASRVARNPGAGGKPVALAQVGADRSSIQVLWASMPTPRPSTSTDPVVATAQANSVGAQWMIAAEESAGRALLADARVTSVCVLTAANEAATIAAYQTLRAIWHELDQLGRADLPVRLAIAGSDEQDAQRAVERIARASGAFADKRVELAAALPRIAPTIATPLFESDSRLDPTKLLDMLTHPSRGVHAEAESTRRASAAQESDRAPASPRPAPLAPSRARVFPSAPERTLASLVNDAALQSTPLQCPDAPRVEVAMDADQALHVLVNAGDDLDAALRDACIVRGWLERQSSLVRLALQIPSQGELRVRTHIFVPAARTARALLDTSISVHLLKPIDAQGQRLWVCEPLN